MSKRKVKLSAKADKEIAHLLRNNGKVAKDIENELVEISDKLVEFCIFKELNNNELYMLSTLIQVRKLLKTLRSCQLQHTPR